MREIPGLWKCVHPYDPHSYQNLSTELWVVQVYAVFKIHGSVHFILCKLHLKKIKRPKIFIRIQRSNGREAVNRRNRALEMDLVWESWVRQGDEKEGRADPSTQKF